METINQDFIKEEVKNLRLDVSTTSRLDEEQFKLLIMLSQLNNTHEALIEEAFDFPYKLIKKRLEVIKKPIEMTPRAIGALAVLTNGVPGRLVMSIIDALNNPTKDNKWDLQDICNLYPNGFYSDKTFENIVDNYLKTKELPNSDIY